jgi:MYXO-CTERM domain-containing protein
MRPSPALHTSGAALGAAAVVAFAAAITILGAPAPAQAQTGTGGSIGTAGSLALADFFIGFQKTEGVNMTDFERSQFLNEASCLCARPLWIRAVLQPSAALKAAAIPPSAQVSLRIGTSCDVAGTSQGCCHILADGVLFSQFRLSGITAETDVKTFAYTYDGTHCSPPQDRDPRVTDNGCAGPQFTQTLWLFISTTGINGSDQGKISMGVPVDQRPPASPQNVTLTPAHEALMVDWTGLEISTATDLKGYQVLCSRTDSLQVFKEGTFTPAFDGCPEQRQGASPVARLDPLFVCSDLLPDDSFRLKILQNDIFYGVGVATIDQARNASQVAISYAKPVANRDFYYEYRHGDPQGAATGGFCAVGGAGGPSASATAGVVLLALMAAARRRSDRHRRRSEP